MFSVDKKECLVCQKTGSLPGFRLSKALMVVEDLSLEVIHDPLVSFCEFNDVKRLGERLECRGEYCNEHPNEHPGDRSSPHPSCPPCQPLVSFCEFKDVRRHGERLECGGEYCNEHPNEHRVDRSSPHPSCPPCRLLCLMCLKSKNMLELVPTNEQRNDHPGSSGSPSACRLLGTRFTSNLIETMNLRKLTNLMCSFKSFNNSMYQITVSSFFYVFYLCPNRSLLVLCGDVEVNPGPGVRRGPGLGPGEETGDGERLDEQVPGNERNSKVIKSNLQVLTQNIRGLSDPKKVRHIVNKCYALTKNAANSFFMFQESFVTRLDILKYLWRGEYHLTSGTGNSRGCLTLVTAPYKIIHTSDFDNRAHVLVLTKSNLDVAEIVLVNVYAPNGLDDEKIRFFEELFEKITETVASYNCVNVILAGDLNLVMNEWEVKNRNYSNSERRIAVSLKNLMGTLNLVDGWDNASKKSFTWTSNRMGIQSFSTLDRVLYTRNNFEVVDKVADWALSVSDHAAVIAGLRPIETRTVKNSRICRLDPRLLLDEEGRLHLDGRFRELTEQIPDGWNPHVRLEYYKMCIRTAANDAVGKIKAKFRDTETILNNDINAVVDELAGEGVLHERKALLMHKLDDLRQLKRNLVDKVGTRLEQKAARKWYNEGELSNKYFFNLLNRKNNDDITTLLDENGVDINDPVLIETKIQEFYKNLYESVEDGVEDNANLFRNIDRVQDDEAAQLMEALTIEELTTTLKSCADSSPGPDGIPYSFLKHFWTEFAPVLLESWNYSMTINELPPSHKVSHLRLIPKVGKDPRIIANLRPITLSNTDHKLITKTLARRLTNVLAGSIGEEQTAYVPGRLINDNVRSMLMTIDLANSDNNVNGVVVSLDAKKAFDSVDHRFIRKCLIEFGLGNFVPVFNVLYKGLRSNIIINGRPVDGYSILKGVKQGDALSCILFIMCMEPLIRNIKANGTIREISSDQLPIRIPKVYSFADDISILAKNEIQGIRAIFNEYETFSKASGLYLNADKTEILCFNGQRDAVQRFDVNYNGSDYRLMSCAQIKINGILLSQDRNQREAANVAKSIESMEHLLSAWSTRRLTLLGRILIIKTYAMSKMIYLMQTFSLSEQSYKDFVKVVFKFLWNKNYNAARAPERLKRSIMYTPVSLGGFGMVDIRALGNSLDLRSYGRLLVTKHPFMAQVLNCVKSDNFFALSTEANVDLKLKRSIELLNIERKRVLTWPSECLLRDINFRKMLADHKLSELLTGAGRQSIAYLSIHRRIPRVKLGQLTIGELDSVARYLKYRELSGVIRDLIAMRLNIGNIQGSIDKNELFPAKDNRFLRMSSLSSKFLRENQVTREDQMICVYKLGPILTPGEVLAWTGRLKKLTSTRHKNILLRVVHGDIFSNGRLAKFGLRQDAGCPNCQEPVETILHKIIGCNKALEAWQELERIKRKLNMNALTDLSTENLIGAKDNLNKLELALQAELIHRMTSRNETYCPRELVKTVVKFVSTAERLKPNEKQLFNEAITNWSG